MKVVLALDEDKVIVLLDRSQAICMALQCEKELPELKRLMEEKGIMKPEAEPCHKSWS